LHVKRLACLLGVSFAALLVVTPSEAAPPARTETGKEVPDEVLVSVKAGANVQNVARAAGAQVHGVLEGLGVHILKVRPGTVARTVAALSRNPQVEFAEPNGYLHSLPNPDDPYDDTTCYGTSSGDCVTQWAWDKVNAYAAWDITVGSPSVRVAIVDTGLDVGDPAYVFPDYTGHEDIVSCQTPIVHSFVSGETGNDDNGHGTHVSGTIGACTNNATGVAGANWAVQLMGVKVRITRDQVPSRRWLPASAGPRTTGPRSST
jgi:thermitase